MRNLVEVHWSDVILPKFLATSWTLTGAIAQVLVNALFTEQMEAPMGTKTHSKK